MFDHRPPGPEEMDQKIQVLHLASLRNQKATLSLPQLYRSCTERLCLRSQHGPPAPPAVGAHDIFGGPLPKTGILELSDKNTRGQSVRSPSRRLSSRQDPYVADH